MNYYGWNDCSFDVKEQIENLVNVLKDYLKNNLVGIYLHGSLCLGCYVQGLSDIDLIILTSSQMEANDKFSLMQILGNIHKRPAPLHLTILHTSDINPWQYPTQFQLQFSEFWKSIFESALFNNKLQQHDIFDGKIETEIAASIHLINQEGICLYGKPIKEAFPQIPEEHFWDSISTDIDKFVLVNESDILTISRIWSYKEEKRILSKMEAGEWVQSRIPEEFVYIIQSAVRSRYLEGHSKQYSITDLKKLKEFIVLKLVEV